MPQIIPIAAAAALAATETTGITAALWIVGASVVSGLLQQATVKKPSFSAGATVEQGGFKLTTRSTQEPHRVIYGTYKVAGNEVFLHATETDNNHLWSVQNFAEGEVEGIVWDTYGEIEIPQIFLDDRIYPEYGGNFSYWFHPGTGDQTYNTALNSVYQEWTDNKRHCAYGVFQLNYTRDYFISKPLITILLKGKKLYDFRTGLTAWSDNPVLAAYDWFTSGRYGVGADPAKVDLDSWTSAANYCDAKGWRLNMVIADRTNSYDIMEDILRHFRGVIIEGGGKYILRYADLNYESVSMNLSDAHIAQNSDGRAALTMAQATRYGKADGLLVKFVDAAKGYSVDDLPVGDRQGVINDLSLLGSTDKAHVLEIAAYFLERSLLDRTISGVFRDDCLGLEPHDLVTLSASVFALDNQLLRVQQKDRQEDGAVALVMSYEDEALYNQVIDITPEEIYTCTLPDPFNVPAQNYLGLDSGVSTARELEDGTLIPRIMVSWDEPLSPFVVKTVVGWRVWPDNGTVKEQVLEFPVDHESTAGKEIYIEGVEQGQTYWIRMAHENLLGKRSDWRGASHTVATLPLPVLASVTLAESLVIAAGAVVSKVHVTLVPHPADAVANIGPTRYYIIEYGRDPDHTDWTRIERQYDHEFDIIAQGDAGNFYLTVTPVGGQAGLTANTSLVLVGKSAPPADVTGLSFVIRQDRMLLSWNPSTDLDVLVGGALVLRHAHALDASWGNAVELPQLPGDSSSTEVEVSPGSWLASWMDSSGHMSATPAAINIDLPARINGQVVGSATSAPGWSGVKTGLVVDAGRLTMDGTWTSGGATFGEYHLPYFDFGAVTDAEIRADLIFSSYTEGLIDARSSLIDTWTDFDGANLQDVRAMLAVRTTDDDPAVAPVWSGAMGFYRAAACRCRAVQVLLYTNSADPTHNLFVSGLDVSYAVAFRQESGADVVSGATALTITYSTPFYAPPVLTITPQGMAEGDYYTVSGKSETGFTIEFKAGGGAAISRTFDWSARIA